MNTSRKILRRDDLKRELEIRRQRGEKIVLANGCFDLLHAGHIRYLKAARDAGDVLVVAVNSDSSARELKGPGRPILDQRGRARLVAALACVDFVTIFDEPNVEPLLQELRPDFHAKGTDYSIETVPERETSARLGIRVVIVGDPKNHSTRDLFTSIRERADG